MANLDRILIPWSIAANHFFARGCRSHCGCCAVLHCCHEALVVESYIYRCWNHLDSHASVWKFALHSWNMLEYFKWSVTLPHRTSSMWVEKDWESRRRTRQTSSVTTLKRLTCLWRKVSYVPRTPGLAPGWPRVSKGLVEKNLASPKQALLSLYTNDIKWLIG